MKISHQPSSIKYNSNIRIQSNNKITDHLTQRDTTEPPDTVSKKHNNHVIIEFSEDALEALKEDTFKDNHRQVNEAYKKELEEKSSFLQSYLKPAQKLHRIIPNIQTNDKLEKSLEGADKKIVDAAYSIIENNLLPHNVKGLSEEERKELISIGLEQAEFLAQNMDADKSKSFMDAMNTIAKYGLNGKTDNQGNVTYDIRQGPIVGAPDNYISTGELMQNIDPEQYKSYTSMLDEAFKKNDTSLFLEATRLAIDWEKNTYKNNPKAFEDEKEKQLDWKEKIDHTKIESSYENTGKDNLHTFINSILEQNTSLKNDYLLQNLHKFAQILNPSLFH